MSQIAMSPDDLDWTIVRFTAPRNGPAKSTLRVGFYGTDRIGFAVTRADIARFTSEQVHNDRYLKRAPAISTEMDQRSLRGWRSSPGPGR